MWRAVLLVLGADPWLEPLGSGHENAESVTPRSSQVQEAFDDFEKALKIWERERKEQLDEQRLERQRAQQKERDEAPLPDAALKKYKVIEVGKGGRAPGKGRSKLIELPRRDEVETQIDSLAAETAERRERCKKDPEGCAREKKQQQALSQGLEAWVEAENAAYEKKRAAMEQQLEAAKQRADAGY